MRRVIAHLKAHKKITANDVISRPTLKKKKEKVLVKRFRGPMQRSLGLGRVTKLHRKTTRTCFTPKSTENGNLSCRKMRWKITYAEAY